MESQLLIDNEARSAVNGATFERRHPTSGAVVTRAAAGTVDDALAAVESASTAYKTWRKSAPSERRRILLKAADALEARTPEFIEVMATEVGASALWAGFNVHLAANLFREAASLATQIQGETIPTDKPGALSMTVRQPVGVVLSIVPWNGPVVLAARAIAYPLVCGNTVVFRASETSPRTHLLVAQALVDAGLPPGALNVLTNAPKDAPDVIDALIAHKAVRRINFTGSTRVGRIIAQKAATHLKRCLLELGGKSPLVVLDDADIDEAVKVAVFGSFLYQGQICMSTERIVVDESIADSFVAKFAARSRELASGDPSQNPACVIGPMVSPDSGKRLNALLDDALAKGAKLACGGHANGATMPADLIAPTVVGHSMQRTLPHASLAMIENTGHCSHMSVPTPSSVAWRSSWPRCATDDGQGARRSGRLEPVRDCGLRPACDAPKWADRAGQQNALRLDRPGSSRTGWRCHDAESPDHGWPHLPPDTPGASDPNPGFGERGQAGGGPPGWQAHSDALECGAAR